MFVSRRSLLLGAAGAATVGAGLTVPALDAQAANPYAKYFKYLHKRSVDMPLARHWYVAQGLTAWGSERLISSYYWGGPGAVDSVLAVMDRNGRFLKQFHLNTKHHVGGLAWTKGYLWVATDHRVFRYSTSKLKNTAHMGRLTADKTFDVRGKASFAYGTGGSSFWVGTCNQSAEDEMHRYEVVNGTPKHRQTIKCPAKTQGVVVLPKRYVWSTSWGNGSSNLIVQSIIPKRHYGPKTAYAAPSRMEGLTMSNGQLQVIFESSSFKYLNSTHKQKAMHFGQVPPL